MVLVTEKDFQFMKLSSLLSFILCAYTQIRLQFVIVQPKEAAYYPRHDAFYVFMILQSTLHLTWLHKLFLGSRTQRCHSDLSGSWSITDVDSRLHPDELPPPEVIVDSLQASYARIYALGNAYLAYANVLWLRENFIFAQILYIFNVIFQVSAVTFMFNRSGPYSLSQKNWLTHVLAKTSIGLGFLYVWRGWGMIDDGFYPPVSELIQTPAICLLLTIAAGPDPTLGLCLIYDLFALVYGPGIGERWRKAFKYDIAIIGATVLVDFVAAKLRGITIVRDDISKPPVEEYQTVTGEEKKSQPLTRLLALI